MINIFIPIDPGRLRKNARTAIRRHGQYTRVGRASDYIAAQAEVTQALADAWDGREMLPRHIGVELYLCVHWPSRRGDVGACDDAVQDCLARAGIIEDDVQVLERVSRRRWALEWPGLDITVDVVSAHEQLKYEMQQPKSWRKATR